MFARFRSFRVEFRIRISRFVALFDFSNLDFCVEFEFVVEFDFSNFDSNLSSKFSIRVSSSSSLNFRVEFVVEFDFSNFVSNFKFEFVVEISRRNFRCLALFDFSNLTLNSSSNSTSRISLLYSTSRKRSSNSTSRISIVDSTSRFKCLEFDDSSFSSNFEFVLIYSTSRMCRRNCCLRAEFFI